MKNISINDEIKSKKFVSFMSRHLVALSISCSYEDCATKRSGTEVFSGFILSFDDNWWWTTAGHCLRDLDEEITNGHLTIHSCGFADFFQLEAPCIYPHPFTYEPECGIYIYEKEFGLDFGIIPLPNLIKLNMQKNGIIPISRENWIYQDVLNFSIYIMLGFPSHLIKNLGGYMPVMIGIERVDPKDLDNAPAETWFAGRIYPEVNLTSIKGMSGGPIYGFRKATNGRWYYHIVAIQSWWRVNSRIIFGCSLPRIAEFIHKSLSNNKDRPIASRLYNICQ